MPTRDLTPEHRDAMARFVKLAGELGFNTVVLWSPPTNPDGDQSSGENPPVLAIHFAINDLALTRSMMEFLIEEKLHTA